MHHSDPLAGTMKTGPMFFILVAAACTLSAQTVESIHVEVVDEQILIHYRIGGSTESQLYNVGLSCSMDGGPRFSPESVHGEVGPNIRGGKGDYTIIWDVFEDLDQVGSAEFFVKVERMDTESPETAFDHSIYLAFNGSTYSPFGLSAGKAGDFGFYGAVRAGTNNDEFQTDYWFDVILGFNKHLFSKGGYRLHAYAGAGSSIEFYEETSTGTSWVEPCLVFDAGVLNVVGRIAISLGLDYVNGYGIHVAYGVGFLF